MPTTNCSPHQLFDIPAGGPVVIITTRPLEFSDFPTSLTGG